jgi:organic radical activating enzyme
MTSEDLGAGRSGEQKRVREKRYAVKEAFLTVQGEGAWAGRPAVFVRLVACNLWSGYEEDRQRDAERSGADCPVWCDTLFTKEGSERMAAAEIAARAAELAGPGGCRFIVLTGGEPLLQADAALMEAFHEAGFEVAVETNGTQRLTDAFGPERSGWPDWIVCSPKLPADQTVIEEMDELKLVVPDYTAAAYEPLVPRVRLHRYGGRARRFLWLQPEDGPRAGEAARTAVASALADPRWRVSVQTHKVLGVE